MAVIFDSLAFEGEVTGGYTYNFKQAININRDDKHHNAVEVGHSLLGRFSVGSIFQVQGEVNDCHLLKVNNDLRSIKAVHPVSPS